MIVTFYYKNTNLYLRNLKQDISNMLSRLIDLPTDQGFAPGSKMFVFQEVIDQGGEPIKVNEYYDTGNKNNHND